MSSDSEMEESQELPTAGTPNPEADLIGNDATRQIDKIDI